MGDLVKIVNMHHTDSKIPYMLNNGEKILFTTQDEVYLNSQSLFVEYIDIIKSPFILFLQTMAQNPNKFETVFNLNGIKGLSMSALGEWYINRKHQNALYDLLQPRFKNPDDPNYDEKRACSIDTMDKFLDEAIRRTPDLITDSPKLNFVSTIKMLDIGSKGVIKKLYVWYPYSENKVILDDIKKLHEDAILLTGELYEIIDEIPHDSTFVFSDITNITVLSEVNRLKLSSILVPSEYKYNYMDDGETLKIDYEEYLKEDLFKFDLFNACTTPIDTP